MISFGRYPEVSLAQARDRRLDARKLVAQGINPSEYKKSVRRAKREAAANSFRLVAVQWHEQWKIGKSERHAGYTIRRLESDVFPAIGNRAISEILAPEIVTLIKKIASRGALDLAKRAHQMIGQVFRYAVAHGLASRNPATDIKPSDIIPSSVKENYARVELSELPELLRAIENSPSSPITRLAVKLLALTFVRTSELIGARWDEFDFETNQWRIPAARMKMKSQHIVPLSTQALKALDALRGITGEGTLLFPNQNDRNREMSNNTILKALEILGYKGRMTGHGFRGLASTALHEQGYDHQHIELQLAHSPRDAVSAAYNHALYIPQRTSMMQDWADYLDSLFR
jgi:integrase